MKLIILTDIHGKVNHISKMAQQLKWADLLIITGDITHFGRREEIRKIMLEIMKYNENIIAVPGNCDYAEVGEYLTEHLMNIDCRVKKIDEVIFAGIGGSLPCPGKTPAEYTEDEYAMMLNEVGNAIEPQIPIVFITHQPPYGTRNDAVDYNEHVGSKAIRNFILKYEPLLCCSGHIHEGIGKDEIGKTKTINPGPFKDGFFAYAEIENSKIQKLEYSNLLT